MENNAQMLALVFSGGGGVGLMILAITAALLAQTFWIRLTACLWIVLAATVLVYTFWGNWQGMAVFVAIYGFYGLIVYSTKRSFRKW